jgi:hypothetical protein
MSSRTRLNIALLALLGILALVAGIRPGLEPPAPPPPLLDPRPERVDRIRIEHPSRPPVVMTRHAERGWVMEQPFRIAANGRRVALLLELAGAPSTSRHSLTGRALGELGLAPPEVVLTLGDRRLEIGARAALDDRRYVRVGDTLHLVDAHGPLDTLTDADPGVWVARSPLPADAKPIALALPALAADADHDQPAAEATELRLESGRWHVEPAPPELSGDSVPMLMDAWRSAQALAVTSHPPAGDATAQDSAESAPPLGEVRFTLEGHAQPLVLLIGALQPTLVLTRPDLGLDYHLPADAASRLLRLPTPGPASPDAGPPTDSAPKRS